MHASDRQPLLPPRKPSAADRIPRQTRSVHLTITVLILAGILLWSRDKGKQKALYPHEGTRLPDEYAICTQDGARVYTVPQSGGVGPVECVLVRGREVIDTGSLSRWMPQSTGWI